jgi:hypothetical protein
MGSKKIALLKAICPVCKIGVAVNKRTAYHTAKLRPKRRKTSGTVTKRRGPQVGRMLTPEGAAASPAFLASVSPPEMPADGWIENLFKVIVAGCVAVSVGLYVYGVDERVTDWGLLLVGFLLVLAFGKLDSIRMKRYEQRLSRYDKTWLCLRCGHEWMETRARQ